MVITKNNSLIKNKFLIIQLVLICFLSVMAVVFCFTNLNNFTVMWSISFIVIFYILNKSIISYKLYVEDIKKFYVNTSFLVIYGIIMILSYIFISLNVESLYTTGSLLFLIGSLFFLSYDGFIFRYLQVKQIEYETITKEEPDEKN